jgi:hypothetical protein
MSRRQIDILDKLTLAAAALVAFLVCTALEMSHAAAAHSPLGRRRALVLDPTAASPFDDPFEPMDDSPSLEAVLYHSGDDLPKSGIEQRTLTYCVVSLVALTLGFLLVRLRRPRPRFRALCRSPGFVAAAATLVVMIFTAAEATWGYCSLGINRDFLAVLTFFFGYASDSAGMTGSCVIAAATALFVAGRLRIRRGWIERLGQALATGWALLFVAKVVHTLISS